MNRATQIGDIPFLIKAMSQLVALADSEKYGYGTLIHRIEDCPEG
jgi:hypothetical protein